MLSEYTYFVLIPIAVGFIIVFYGLYLFIKSKETNKWNETKGIVLKSEIDKSSTASGMDGNSISFKALVEYKYEVDNQEYISSRIFYGDSMGKPLPFKAKSLVKRYPKDAEINVYFNPLKPKESVLEKGIKFIVIEMFILGSFFILLGFLFEKYEMVIKPLLNIQ